MMTRGQFLTRYRAELARVDATGWTQNPERMERFMSACVAALNGDRAGTGWSNVGTAVIAAWRGLGGLGKPTMAQLRALPVDPAD